MPTNYPTNIDSYAVHADNVSENIIAASDNNVQDAVKAIETELGTNPKGIKADVKTRITDIENGYISTAGAGLSKTVNTLSIPDNGVTDTMIGNKTADDTLAPVGLIGTLTQWFSWITNRIKTITGKTNWYDTPTKSLEQLNNEKFNNIGGTITGQTIISGVGNPLVLKGGATNEVFTELYANAAAQNTRSGYTGFAVPGSPDFYLNNEMTNGNMNLLTNGTGLIKVKGLPIMLNGQDATKQLQIKYGSAVATTDGNGFATILFASPFPTDCVAVVDWNGDGVTTGSLLITSYGAGAYLYNGFTARAFETIGNTPYTNKSIRVDYMALGY